MTGRISRTGAWLRDRLSSVMATTVMLAGWAMLSAGFALLEPALGLIVAGATLLLGVLLFEGSGS